MTQPDFKTGSSNRHNTAMILPRVYDESLLKQAEQLLIEAEQAARDSALFKQRVAFVRTGFEATRLLSQNLTLMQRVRDTGGKDTKALEQVTANWTKLEALSKVEPYALSWVSLTNSIRGKGYMGDMQDYFGPPTEELLATVRAGAAEFDPAQWKLALSDDFNRSELGADWKIEKGKWTVSNGTLQGSSGVLACTRRFPGLHRMVVEFTVQGNPELGDVSPFIQAGGRGFSSGYATQFGGRNNTVNVVQRMGRICQESTTPLIEPGRRYQLISEYDGSTVRLQIDGKTVVEFRDPQGLAGSNNDRLGIYLHEGEVTFHKIEIHTSPAVPKSKAEGMGEGFE